jgi:hypothetical protein
MDPTSFFDVLEPRALLSAPVATVQSFAVTAVTMTLVVSYTSDTGIDPSSIGLDDIAAAGPRWTRYPFSATIVSQGPNETVAKYVIRSVPVGPYLLWDNGTHNLGIFAGSVRSTDGAGIAETGAGSYWLWFPDVYPEISRMEPYSWGVEVVVNFWTRTYNRVSAPVSIRLTLPDGSQQVNTRTMDNYYTTFWVDFNNAGDRPWDYTDHGTFTFDIGDHDGAQVNYRLGGQYWLWFSNPKMEIVSTDVTDTAARIVVRITDDHAVDLTSFSGRDLYVSVGFLEVLPSMDGPNISAPVVEPQADGSVIATYWRAPYQSAFTNRESGEWVFGASRPGWGPPLVRDVDGNYAQIGVLRRETHVFNRVGWWASPALTAHADDPSHAQLFVTFFSNNVDTSTLGDGDVRLELNGQTYQLSLTLGYGGGSGSLTFGAYYALQLPQGQRLQTGTGRFYLNAGAVTTGGQPNEEAFLGEFWFWFY